MYGLFKGAGLIEKTSEDYSQEQHGIWLPWNGGRNGKNMWETKNL